MGQKQQSLRPARALTPLEEGEVNHYIPRFILDEFRLGKNGRQRWLLYDKAIFHDGPFLHEISDIDKQFRFNDTTLWCANEHEGAFFFLAGPSRRIERKLNANEIKAAEIIRSITAGGAGAASSLKKNERLHLNRFLSLLCVRNPHFYRVIGQLLSSVSAVPLARAAGNGAARPKLILKDSARAGLEHRPTALEIDQGIDIRFSDQLSGLLKNSPIQVIRIEDPDTYFVTGSFPACPIETERDGKEYYMCTPVTKKIAICYDIRDKSQSRPGIEYLTAGKDTVRDINRFIYEASNKILVQSEEHLEDILSAPAVRLHRHQGSSAIFALSDTTISPEPSHASNASQLSS